MKSPADPAFKKQGPKSGQRVIKLTPTDRAPFDRLIADLPPLFDIGAVGGLLATPKGDVIIDLVPFGTVVILKLINAVNKRQGAGTAAMEIICAAADRQRVTLCLAAVPLQTRNDRKMSKPKLIAFYRYFGFEQDHRNSDSMTRLPR